MQIKTKIVSGDTADSKPVKQEVNGTVILPPLVIPVRTLDLRTMSRVFYRSIVYFRCDKKLFKFNIEVWFKQDDKV